MDTGQYEKYLLNMLLEECSLKELVNACAALLGSPIRFIFHRKQNGYIASDDYSGEDALKEQLVMGEWLDKTGEDLSTLLQKTLTIYGLQPFIPDAAAGKPPYRRLMCLVCTGGHADGFLVLPEKDIPLENIDKDLMYLCARCLSMCMRQRKWNWQQTRYRRAMQMLLSDKEITYQDVVHESGELIFPEHAVRRLLVIRSLMPNAGDGLNVLASQTATSLKTEWLHLEQRTAVILFENEAIPPDFATHYPPLLDLAGCSACLSPVFNSLMHTGLWESRCGRLPAFITAPAGRLIMYDDWLDWGLIAEAKLQRDDLEDFIPLGIRHLREYDRNHDTVYLDTLKKYFENQCGKQQTALSMGTHVNTVCYRLQKAEEITGIALHDPKALFILPRAIRLMEYQEAQLIRTHEKKHENEKK